MPCLNVWLNEILGYAAPDIIGVISGLFFEW